MLRMILDLAAGERPSRRGVIFGSGSDIGQRPPELAVPWTNWREQFASSILVLLRGPVPPKYFLGAPFFRDCWIEQPFPKLAFGVAIICQVLLILFPPPIWNVRPARNVIPVPQMELTWYGPVRDLPAIFPARPVAKPARPGGTSKKETRRGSDAFHPRLTIITAPLHPTHPRQALIQPAAPPMPPKILPPLPNVVQFAAHSPARPKPQLTPKQLAAMRPKLPAHLATPDVAIPQVEVSEKLVGTINIASSLQTPVKPVVQVAPMSAPRAGQRKEITNAAVPEVATVINAGANTLIALSTSPAPVAPPANVPAGNLTARLSISPEGKRPGIPGGLESNNAGENASGAVGGPDLEGVFIKAGNSAGTAPTSGPASGLGMASSPRSAGNSLPSRPVSRVSAASSIPASDSKSSSSGSLNLKPGAPEDMLGSKRIYTLHVNMPNLTSVSGSWILNFAELDEQMPDGFPDIAASQDLVGPVPLRKVDPKYPPELRAEHVEGEVVLYAVIRKDGTVDSIQLVHGVDSHLDANAMDALAQWKFRPAEKQGAPVDLEAVVHIPFRSRALVY